MKFTCGHCGGTIREGDYSKHYESFVPHDECGHETFFPTFIPSNANPHPIPGEVRKTEGHPAHAVTPEQLKLAAVKYIMCHGYDEAYATKCVEKMGASAILSDTNMPALLAAAKEDKVKEFVEQEKAATVALKDAAADESEPEMQSEWADDEDLKKEAEAAKEKAHRIPSADDLDKDAEEKAIAAATSSGGLPEQLSEQSPEQPATVVVSARAQSQRGQKGSGRR